MWSNLNKKNTANFFVQISPSIEGKYFEQFPTIKRNSDIKLESFLSSLTN